MKVLDVLIADHTTLPRGRDRSGWGTPLVAAELVIDLDRAHAHVRTSVCRLRKAQYVTTPTQLSRYTSRAGRAARVCGCPNPIEADDITRSTACTAEWRRARAPPAAESRRSSAIALSTAATRAYRRSSSRGLPPKHSCRVSRQHSKIGRSWQAPQESRPRSWLRGGALRQIARSAILQSCR